MVKKSWEEYLEKALTQLKQEDEVSAIYNNIVEPISIEGSPTSIFEMRLLTTKVQDRKLLKILDCCRMHYNAVLGYSLKRLHLVKTDPEYKKIIAIPKNTAENRVLRQKKFNELNIKWGFTKGAIESWGTKSKNNSVFIAQHCGAHVLQKLSNRAFESVLKVALGKSKKVNFVKKGDYKSIAGKNNSTFLRFQNNTALISDMVIKCKVRKNDKAYNHFLKHRIKYCQLVARKIKNTYKFFIQMAYEGHPYKKVELGKGKSCADIGPSTIALVEKDKVSLEKFCSELTPIYKEISRLQRKASRKLRLANPKNYTDNGAIRKGRKTWIRSRNYLKLQNKIANLNRQLSSTRKKIHGTKINKIVQNCDTFSAEKLSYKAFQKLYGKSVGRCSPAQFINRLKAKVELLGGTFIEIKTYDTKLSQTCLCGNIKKKKLSERIHKCSECGLEIQRDILSAYLGLHVSKSGKKLNLKTANKEFVKFKPLVDDCIIKLKELKKAEPHKVASTFGI